MIEDVEVQRRAAGLGVSGALIEKDHLVSHLLAGLVGLPLRFFGGTALARTVLDGHRLSEDIDLMVGDPAFDLEGALGRGLARSVGPLEWQQTRRSKWLRELLVRADGTEWVRIQLVHADERQDAWGWISADVRLWYSCLPESVPLSAPDGVGFAAMKLAAYRDRRAPRDLFDLAALATA